jgi:hypothetical protein
MVRINFVGMKDVTFRTVVRILTVILLIGNALIFVLDIVLLSKGNASTGYSVVLLLVAVVSLIYLKYIYCIF